MKTKNEHNGEHRTYPANKMIPKEVLSLLTRGQRKVKKKLHNKRSRCYNNSQLRDHSIYGNASDS